VAAYKSLELVRLATAAGHSVRAIQTPASLQFVGAASFAALTGAPVLIDEFESDPARGAFPGQAPAEHLPIAHLEIVRNADLYLVAPASANTLAKLAHGLADNLLTVAVLAASCPLVVAPAMNDAMFEHPATQANLALLRERGVVVIDPDVGALASRGEWGAGRLPAPARLLEICEQLLGSQASEHATWRGLRVLVSAGGTREAIDGVRYIGNRSSGRMGFALADAAAARGADVTVVAANVALPRNGAVTYREVVSAAELQATCELAFADCDVLLMSAAVADFRPRAAHDGKLHREGRDELLLELEPTEDVLLTLSAQRRPGQTLIGFAAEHGDEALARARAKLARKGLDAIVVNDVSRPDIGFDGAHNEVTIVTAAGDLHVPRASKQAVAEAVLDAVAHLRALESTRDGVM
jgi:phosphopantothenoylcysteine decarboxylase/phosphopantothenate--cysteine ligase